MKYLFNNTFCSFLKRTFNSFNNLIHFLSHFFSIFNICSRITKFNTLLAIILLCTLISSCENFLEVEPPVTKIGQNQVFSNDATATAAISGIYLDLYNENSFAGGSVSSVMVLGALSADELHNDPTEGPQLIAFEQNNLMADNTYVLSIWTSLYKSIFQANALLEGLDNSSGVTSNTANQLRGEALFVRAFCNFYLVNLFSDVPLVLSTNYKANALIPKTATDAIYNHIKSDLLEAENLLSADYISTGRVRPNRFAATAMLARIYLYTKDWQRAEDKATNVINKTSLYSLPVNLNSVFVSTSGEAIWQLEPKDNATYTNEGSFFISSFRPTVLDEETVSSFESNDKREAEWVNSISTTLHRPYKYKKPSNNSGPQIVEYSMVLRLAEQYLIRAEARLKQGKVSQAIADIDAIRSRAGLTLIQDTNPNITEENLILVIEQERRLELLTEWSHRWFDLKRWGKATEILAPLKSNWTLNDELYPLPAQELIKNINLKPQNSGY